jgi:hypothetical protein
MRRVNAKFAKRTHRRFRDGKTWVFLGYLMCKNADSRADSILYTDYAKRTQTSSPSHKCRSFDSLANQGFLAFIFDFEKRTHSRQIGTDGLDVPSLFS